MNKIIIVCALVLIVVVGSGCADEAKLNDPDEIHGFVDFKSVIDEAKPISLDNVQVQGRANQNSDAFQPVALDDLIAKANKAY